MTTPDLPTLLEAHWPTSPIVDGDGRPIVADDGQPITRRLSVREVGLLAGGQPHYSQINKIRLGLLRGHVHASTIAGLSRAFGIPEETLWLGLGVTLGVRIGDPRAESVAR
jgi:hypothetical protein